MTGDLGIIKRGFLDITGRLKNVIVGPSGENIYPEDIESLINENEFVVESLVTEQGGKLTANIHLNYDYIDQIYGSNSLSESKLKKEIVKILQNLKTEVNSKVSTFSKISKVQEQAEPFEKTPTQKIKRYLYR